MTTNPTPENSGAPAENMGGCASVAPRRMGDHAYAGFILCLIVLIATMAFALTNMTRLERDMDAVVHSQEVRLGLSDLLGSLVDAQGSKRGYVITGELVFLYRFEAAVAETNGHVGRLRGLLGRSAAQRARLGDLEALIDSKFAEMSRVIALRQSAGLEAAASVVLADVQTHSMTDIRAEIGSMTSEESGVLRQRVAAAATSRTVTLRAVVLGLVLGLATAGFSVWRIRREFDERRESHRAIREREARFRELAEAIDEVFWVSGPDDRRMQYVSPAFETIWGRPCASLIADPDLWIEAVHPGDRDTVRRAAGTGPAGRFDITYRIVRPDGEVRWIRDRGFPIRGEEGVVLRRVGIAQDFTELKEAEIALRQSDALTRMWLNECTDGVWDWNLETDEEYLSPSLKRLLGYDDDELPNRASTWRELVWAQDLPQAAEAFRLHMEDGEAYNLPLRFRHRNGSLVWVMCRGVAIRDEAGRFTRMVGTHTDISRLKRVESELERARDNLELTVQLRTSELRRTNEELEQFAYAASHDLKTPLVTFLGFLNMLDRLVGVGDDDGARDSIDRMQRAAAKMQRLIDDLLEISRIGRVVHEAEPVRIADLAREFAELALPSAEHGVRVEIDESTPVVTGDPTRLRQVLHNLLTNAVKYGCGESGGVIRVAGRVDEAETCFCVRDEGPGIDKPYQEKIFGLFQRLDSSTEGTGVGLAIVRRAIECQGGRVWVESEPGRGATFWVAMPRESALQGAA
jgi:PAS domain S-box-containing protein